jgi:hypothetical protein
MIQATVKNSKTGSQYICKSASKTVKDIAYKHISYYFICRYRNHPFFKQFYHGPNGIQTGSERYKEIEAIEKIYPEYTDTRITRANHHGNTPRRSYQVRKTVTRI